MGEYYLRILLNRWMPERIVKWVISENIVKWVIIEATTTRRGARPQASFCFCKTTSHFGWSVFVVRNVLFDKNWPNGAQQMNGTNGLGPKRAQQMNPLQWIHAPNMMIYIYIYIYIYTRIYTHMYVCSSVCLHCVCIQNSAMATNLSLKADLVKSKS